MCLPEHIRKKRIVKVGVLLIVVGTLLFWWFNFPFKMVSRKLQHFIHMGHQNDSKTILIWNVPHIKGIKDFGVGRDAFYDQGCDYIQCEILANRSLRPYEEYDVILIAFDDFSWPHETDVPTFNRNIAQKFVFLNQESPYTLNLYHNMHRFPIPFNWTMTYRTDSDIPIPRGRIVPKSSEALTAAQVAFYRKEVSKRPPVSINKNKTVTWMASYCNTNSQRELYVKELSKYIQIDVYGECGNLTCGRNKFYYSDLECYEMLESTYKFYLSFEDSICEDYVTEKFFKIMKHQIVPVVYGGANYSHHAPPHSYIDARKYKPKELAAYLNLLAANETLYNEYFWWKEHYRVETGAVEMIRQGLCNLCQKLYQDPQFSSYADLASRWSDGSQCTTFDPKWIS